MLKSRRRRRTRVMVRLLQFGSVGLFGFAGGCFPNGLGADLIASTAAAVVGDTVFTILDFVLPTVP